MSWLLTFLRDLTDLQIGLPDVVDILMVALLIYGLLVLLKGSRAMQMLWGILAIVLLYLGSAALNLVTLSTVLGKFLVFLPFAIIVLFQQEIRRMLSAFGTAPLSRLLGEQEEGYPMVNEIAQVAVALAKGKTGALIAIQRRDSLAAWVETGILLDARFSYDLLMNIFIPDTPLHDGAVIVRGETIAAASCFLPLTTQAGLSTALGTRHRAAIGLSEETDAVVVVVSEETGDISLAVGGQLLRHLDEMTVRNALIEHLYQLGPEAEENA